jgi:hypothetical protein
MIVTFAALVLGAKRFIAFKEAGQPQMEAVEAAYGAPSKSL